MRGFLLDTCVISEPTRPKASDKVLAWLNARPAESLYISVITIAEIEQGIAHIGAGPRARKLEAWLRDSLAPLFESRTLEVDLAIAHRWGRLQGDALRSGRALAVIDSMLAATAMEHDLTVVTRNTKDFAPLDIPLINPWQ
ncbi:MAG: type II toxin-antitoxin system VapC family toxin [Dokdonella sp.]